MKEKAVAELRPRLASFVLRKERVPVLASRALLREKLNIYTLFYWCALTVLLALGAWQRFALPLTPFADFDAWKSLNPALSALSGTGFYRTEAGSSFYPSLLLGILRITGDMRGITVVQHVMGLGCAVLVLAGWERLRSFYTQALVPRWLHDAIGLILFATCLFARNRTAFEHQIRPEAMTGFFTALSFVLALEFIRVRCVQRGAFAGSPNDLSPRPRLGGDLVLGGALLLNVFLLFLLKPSFALTMLLASIPIWCAVFDRRETRGRRAVLVLPALSIIGFLIIADRQLPPENKAVDQFLPATLFVVHAEIIADQMELDLKSGARLRYDREMLSRIYTFLREEIEKSRAPGKHYWATVGFDPDYLLYEDFVWVLLPREMGQREARKRFYAYYYWRAWTKQPLAMLRKIGREMQEFYSHGRAYREFKDPHRLATTYETSATAFRYHPDAVNGSTIGRDYLAQCAALSTGNGVIGQVPVMRDAMKVINAGYFPILICAMAAAIVIFAVPSARKRYVVPAWLVLFFYSYNLGNCLATSIVHSLSVQRYIRAQFVFTLFSEAAGLLLIMELAYWTIRGKSGRLPMEERNRLITPRMHPMDARLEPAPER